MQELYYAAMAELVDALDSGSSRGNSVDVRVILAAFPYFSIPENSLIQNLKCILKCNILITYSNYFGK